jgi:energy-coupling factor transporter ATP-binding protein EcfA2
MEKIKKILGFNELPMSKTSHCVLIIGVKGSGKSHLVKTLEKYIPIKLENYGVIDGDLIRENYRPLDNFPDKNLYIKYIKNVMLFDSIIEKRNLILLDSGEKAEYYYDLFTEHGYKISIVGVYVDNWEEIAARGYIRFKNTGRQYTGTKEMWYNSIDIIYSLIKKDILHSIIIDNTDYNNPIIKN